MMTGHQIKHPPKDYVKDEHSEQKFLPLPKNNKNTVTTMPIIQISSLSHPGVEIFSTLTEAQLRNRIEPSKGIFIAESPKVITVALEAGYEPLALLCRKKAYHRRCRHYHWTMWRHTCIYG